MPMQWTKNQTGGDINWVEQIQGQQTQQMATNNNKSSQNRAHGGLHEFLQKMEQSQQ